MPTPPTLNTWLVGRVRGSDTLHAAMLIPLTEGSRLVTLHTRCAASAGRGGHTSERIFTADLIDTADGHKVCADCLAEWEADQADQAGPDTPTKTCTSCRTPQPTLAFRRDRRTRDGRSTTCRRCRHATRDVIAESTQIVAAAAAAIARERENAARTYDLIGRVGTWQSSPLLPTFTCSAGHTLTAGAGQRRTPMTGETVTIPVWLCPCGRAPIATSHLALIAAGLAFTRQVTESGTTVAIHGGRA